MKQRSRYKKASERAFLDQLKAISTYTKVLNFFTCPLTYFMSFFILQMKRLK